VLEEHATSPTAADGVGDVERAGNATFETKRTGRGDSEVVQVQKNKVVTTAAGDRNAAEDETETESRDSSLEGKFVNLVDLLLPVPIKGKFDVNYSNKIKSSLYFFS
jgi:hypothetical protein